MGTSRGLRAGAVLAAVALLSAGCLQEEGGGGGGDAGAGGGGGEGDGQVEIFGAFGGDEERLFVESLAEFEEESGIAIEYVSSGDFDTIIRSRVQGNNAPDIALFPQPGLLLDLSRDMVPLGDALDLAALEETLIPGFLEAATGEDGNVYGAPMRMAVKSLVWHPVPEFEEAGYAPAESHQELVELTEQIKADGNTPWCLGIESQAATGWVATDWIEEYVLRVGGPEFYDQWVAHEVPFNDPIVKEAAEKFAEIAFTEGNVVGGRQTILSTPFGDSPNLMFNDPPGCYLHRQGNFVTGFFPEDVQADLAANTDIFVLPPVEDGYDGQPILGGGDLAAMFNQDEDTVAVMEFLTSDQFGGPWAQGGGWLSPHATFDTGNYSNELEAQIAQAASEADVFRFDGSDLMPGAVGTGTFWTGMVEWISGSKEIDQVLEEIEASWPTS